MSSLIFYIIINNMRNHKYQIIMSECMSKPAEKTKEEDNKDNNTNSEQPLEPKEEDNE